MGKVGEAETGQEKLPLPLSNLTHNCPVNLFKIKVKEDWYFSLLIKIVFSHFE